MNHHLRLSHRSLWDEFCVWAIIMYAAVRCAYIFLIQRSFGPTIFDELLCVILLPYAVLGLFKPGYIRSGYLLLLFALGSLGSSFLGYLIYGRHLGTENGQAFTGVVLDAKFYLFVFSFLAIFSMCIVKPKDISRFMKVLIFISLFNFIFVAHDVVVGHDIYGGALMSRSGMLLPNGVFGHKTSSAQIHLLALAASLSMRIRTGSSVLLLIALGNFFAVFLHQGSKEIVAAIIIFIIYFYYQRHIRISHFLVAMPLFLGVALFLTFADDVLPNVAFLERIQYYMSDEGAFSARRVLWDGAEAIASDHFPLGTGAGSYGSEPSRRENFSIVYDMYGVNGFGMTELNPSFLTDNYWAKVLGESGVIGLSFVFLFLLTIFLYGLKILNPVNEANERTRFWSSLDFFSIATTAAAFVCSFGSSVFSSEVMAIPLAFSMSYVAWRANTSQALHSRSINRASGGLASRRRIRHESKAVKY